MVKYFVILLSFFLINSENSLAMLTSSQSSSRDEGGRDYVIDDLTRLAPAKNNETTFPPNNFWRYFECVNGIQPSDPEKIAQACMQAAADGDDRASLLVALLYFIGKGVPEDERKGLEWLRRSSDLDNPIAQLTLAFIELIKPKPDFASAFHLAKESYDAGFVEAGFLLALVYLDGKGVEKNYAIAKKYLLELDPKFPEAQYVLGGMALKGYGGPVDLELAIQYLTSAAESGCLSAMDLLAFVYLENKGHQNEKCARKWLERCAQEKYPNCQYNLGYMYEKGLGGEQNDDNALRYYRLAAQNNHIAAQYKLGLAYDKGRGVLPDYQNAVYWIMVAANGGYPDAQNVLGTFYANGTGVGKNQNLAAKWFRKAAEQGNLNAKANLWQMFLRNELKQSSRKQCLLWLKEAAASGHPMAEHCLGLLYLDGTYVKQDSGQAWKLIELAANAGYAPAQHDLGVKYRDGMTEKESYAEALKWFDKAAKQGDRISATEIGIFYLYGKGVIQDFAKAFSLLSDNAAEGVALAQYHLSLMYLFGQGIPKNGETAFFWMEKATASEDPRIAAGVYLMLGNFYCNGVGVEKNVAYALACYETSASKGNSAGAYNAGGFYLEGIGTSKNLEKAVKYLTMAMEGGHAEAPRLLGELYYNGKLATDLNKAKYFGQIALQRGDVKAAAFLKAIKNLELVEKNPLYVKYKQGVRSINKGDLELAETTFRELLAYPEFAGQSYLNLGIIFGMKKNYGASIDNFQKALQIDPQNADTWGNLGYTYMQMGWWQKAVDALKTALKWDPNHQRSQVNLRNARKILMEIKTHGKASVIQLRGDLREEVIA